VGNLAFAHLGSGLADSARQTPDFGARFPIGKRGMPAALLILKRCVQLTRIVCGFASGLLDRLLCAIQKIVSEIRHPDAKCGASAKKVGFFGVRFLLSKISNPKTGISDRFTIPQNRIEIWGSGNRSRIVLRTLELFGYIPTCELHAAGNLRFRQNLSRFPEIWPADPSISTNFPRSTGRNSHGGI